MQRMIIEFQPGDQIEVITFTSDDPKRTAAKKCYHACGFTDDKLLMIHAKR